MYCQLTSLTKLQEYFNSYRDNLPKWHDSKSRQVTIPTWALTYRRAQVHHTDSQAHRTKLLHIQIDLGLKDRSQEV